MLNILVKAVFYIISAVGSLILMPFTLLIGALFPDVTNFIQGILSYLSDFTQYIPFVFKFLLIPKFCVQALLLLFTVYLSFRFSILAISLVMSLWQKFKP